MKRLDRMKETETKQSEQDSNSTISLPEIYADYTVGSSSARFISNALNSHRNETNLSPKESKRPEEITILSESLKTLETTIGVSNENLTRLRDEKNAGLEELKELDQQLNQQKFKQLLNLIRLGKLDDLEKQLNLGVDPNIQDSYGNTLLHHAAYFGQTAIVSLLLLKKVDPTRVNSSGQLPLHLADKNHKQNYKQLKILFAATEKQIRKNSKKKENSLLDKPANDQPQTTFNWRNALNPEKNSCLGDPIKDLKHLITSKTKEQAKLDQEIILINDELKRIRQQIPEKRKLIEEYKKEEFEILLSLSKRKEDSETLSYYLKHDFDPNIRDTAGSTVLYHAIFNGNITAVEKLQTNKFNNSQTFIVNKFGESPLHLAAQTNNIELVNLVLMNSNNEYISNARVEDNQGNKAIAYLDPNHKSYLELNKLLQEAEVAAGNIYLKMDEQIKSELRDMTNKAHQFLKQGMQDKNLTPEVLREEMMGYLKRMKEIMLKNIGDTILLEKEKSTLSSTAEKTFSSIAFDIALEIPDTSAEVPNCHL